MVLVSGPSPNGAVAKSRLFLALRIMVGQLALWAWACLLKTPLLSLACDYCFTVSYLDPKVPTKPLLSVGGCQIILAESKSRGTPILPSCRIFSYFCI